MTDDAPVLDQLNLIVRDMDAMVDFYRALGIEIDAPPPPWDRHHRTASIGGGLDLDFDSAEFAPKWNQGFDASRAGAGVVVGFRVRARDAVDALFDKLTALGHEGQQPPYDAFWGARYAIVTDPDGNAVGIMSAVDPDRRTEPPNIG